jgi:hypothetical protein
MRTDYTREELADICSRAFMPEAVWRNRDSSSAQRQVGEALALLKAGCEFRVCDSAQDEPCITNEKTIWLEISFKGFRYFDEGANPEVDTFYLPTPERLQETAGRDWY